MNSGPPRFAAFWCDLKCGANQVKITTDTNPGAGLPNWTRDRLHGVPDSGFAVTHNFGMLMRDDGYLELIFGSNNASQYDQITGIGPGLAGGTRPTSLLRSSATSSARLPSPRSEARSCRAG